MIRKNAGWLMLLAVLGSIQPADQEAVTNKPACICLFSHRYLLLLVPSDGGGNSFVVIWVNSPNIKPILACKCKISIFRSQASI